MCRSRARRNLRTRASISLLVIRFFCLLQSTFSAQQTTTSLHRPTTTTTTTTTWAHQPHKHTHKPLFSPQQSRPPYREVGELSPQINDGRVGALDLRQGADHRLRLAHVEGVQHLGSSDITVEHRQTAGGRAEEKKGPRNKRKTSRNDQTTRACLHERATDRHQVKSNPAVVISSSGCT